MARKDRRFVRILEYDFAMISHFLRRACSGAIVLVWLLASCACMSPEQAESSSLPPFMTAPMVMGHGAAKKGGLAFRDGLDAAGRGLVAATEGVTAGAHGVGAVVAGPVLFSEYFVSQRRASRAERELAAARAQLRVAEMDSREKSARRAARVRYLAVSASPAANPVRSTTPVMVWDTQTLQLVGDAVYEIKSDTPPGYTAKFETHVMEYIGPATR